MNIKELTPGRKSKSKKETDKNIERIIDYIRENGRTDLVDGYIIASASELKEYLISEGYDPKNKIVAGLVAWGRRRVNRKEEPLVAKGRIKIFESDDDFYLGLKID